MADAGQKQSSSVPRGVVLVVEDDDGIRDVLTLILESEGYQVITAIHGAVALEQVRLCRPSLILLDLMMPVMNGWEFLKIQKLDPSIAQIPVVVISAGLGKMVQCLGAKTVLNKPFNLATLVQIVNRYAVAS